MSDAYLEIKVGRSVKQVAIEGDKLAIGRQPDSDVVLDDTQASRNHCLIERVGADYLLRDLNSRNGTRVNGQLITTVTLAPNDLITIGQVEMRFFIPEAAESTDLLSADDLVDADDLHDGKSTMP